MPNWISAFVVAILVVVIPFTVIVRLMVQLPKAVALSHSRWPMPANFAVIAGITAYTTIFVRNTYYGHGMNALGILMEFVIAGLAYVFGLVLLLRQFSGLYPEYIITTGRLGEHSKDRLQKHHRCGGSKPRAWRIGVAHCDAAWVRPFADAASFIRPRAI